MTAAVSHPIELVTFDLYDTLMELDPPRWVRLGNALCDFGIEASEASLMASDLIAEDYYTIENGGIPIRDRTIEEQQAFRLEYMRRWLEAAGLPCGREFAAEVRARYLAEFESGWDHHAYRLFDDVMPTLHRLRAAGVKTALISNADADVTNIAVHFAFADRMDLLVTSALVGYEKPDPRTYRAALDSLGVDPARSIHVGDQAKSDVVGALGVGMQAALLDRYHRHSPGAHDGLIVASLTELADLVLA
ncbi:MAG: HAD family hydrolase [Thermomicrobiales bacterium]